jgi:hypothetical protein
MLVAGNRQAPGGRPVVAVDGDGQVHFIVLPGSVEKIVTSSAVPLPELLPAPRPARHDEP